MSANIRALFVERIIVEVEVRDHAAARVDLIDEVARSVTQRMVDVDGVVEEDFGQPILEQVDVCQIRLQLGDKDIYALGVLGCQLVGPAVAGPHER